MCGWGGVAGRGRSSGGTAGRRDVIVRLVDQTRGGPGGQPGDVAGARWWVLLTLGARAVFW